MPAFRESAIFDPALETQSWSELRQHQRRRLQATLAHAYQNAPKFRELMQAAKLQPGDIATLEDIVKLPIVRKDNLAALQSSALPFGGLTALAVQKLARIFVSPGNIYDPQGPAEDFWRFRPALTAAGFRAGDIVLNTFSYHMTPAGFMFDGALRALGCVVVPTGVGQSEQQVRVAHDVGVTGYVGTPSFLHALLSKARVLNTPLQIEAAFVTAEMLPPSLRAELEQDFGVRVLQGYGTADLGMLAYECPQKDGLHVHPDCIVEILDIESKQPAAPGQPGELVATIFDDAYPLIRFATGDLSSFSEYAACACARGAPKLSGLLGRVGDAVKVKGMFVRGSQIDAAIKLFAEVARYQAIVTREGHQDQLTYRIELAEPVADAQSLANRLADALRDAVKVRGEVAIVGSGVIAQNANKIDDRREWK